MFVSVGATAEDTCRLISSPVRPSGFPPKGTSACRSRPSPCSCRPQGTKTYIKATSAFTPPPACCFRSVPHPCTPLDLPSASHLSLLTVIMPSVQKRPRGQLVRLAKLFLSSSRDLQETDQKLHRRIPFWATMVSSEGRPVRRRRPSQRIAQKHSIRQHETCVYQDEDVPEHT